MRFIVNQTHYESKRGSVHVRCHVCVCVAVESRDNGKKVIERLFPEIKNYNILIKTKYATIAHVIYVRI